MPEPLLVVVAGPTASGKTEVGIQLASHFQSVVLSADSRQLYFEIPIGSAAPTAEQRARVPHFFVGDRSITQPCNASQYQNEVLARLDDVFKNHRCAFLVGGSGLYIDAVCKGFDTLPDPDPRIREEVHQFYQKEGLNGLRNWLSQLDPVYYSLVDLNNPARLMRAIEVCLITGQPYSSLRTGTAKHRPFRVLKLALNLPREELFLRIAHRTDSMIEEGLVEEALSLKHLRYLNTLRTVGYEELFAHFDGLYSLDDAVEKIKTNTRRYAKRQLTWFRKDPQYQWFSPKEIDSLINIIDFQLNKC
ncbi:MAG: tRNA (adenosine(37)-N6)-dimethylallyltransferase MiaA [Bacteroidales bacterium]